MFKSGPNGMIIKIKKDGTKAIIGANRSGVFLHLMPILSAIMAMIIFDEKFMFYHFLGAIFIILGITLSNKKN